LITISIGPYGMQYCRDIWGVPTDLVVKEVEVYRDLDGDRDLLDHDLLDFVRNLRVQGLVVTTSQKCEAVPRRARI